MMTTETEQQPNEFYAITDNSSGMELKWDSRKPVGQWEISSIDMIINAYEEPTLWQKFWMRVLLNIHYKKV